jgi:hypothetical protein
VAATVQDDLDLGVFLVSVTLTKSGDYDLTINLNGLEVPHSVSTIEVLPKQATSPETSVLSGIEASYLTGDSI